VNLYLISQSVNNDYDTYDSAVVAAETELAARATHPNGDDDPPPYLVGCWAQPEDVKVTLVGVAVEGTEAGVICASFNAG